MQERLQPAEPQLNLNETLPNSQGKLVWLISRVKLPAILYWGPFSDAQYSEQNFKIEKW